MFTNNLKQKLSYLVNSMCFYQFTSSCEARYTGRSMSILSKRIQENYPAWLKRDRNTSIRSSIIEHLVNTDQSIKTYSAFKVFYEVIRRLATGVIIHLLSISEALAIHLENPELFAQTKLAQHLHLS